MGALFSVVVEDKPSPVVESSPQESRRPLRDRVEYHCSSKGLAAKERPPQLVRRSYAANQAKSSFLDLPAELRNNIYSQLLIMDGYVRLTEKKTTKVPALKLLRVCKQLHDEAASIFYAANSFYCSTKCEFSLKTTPHETITYSMFDEPWLSKIGGFFPAPRYHTHLTRLTIDKRVSLQLKGYVLSISRNEKRAVFRQTRAEVDRLFFRTYDSMRMLWEDKPGQWEGRLLVSEHDWYVGAFNNYTISFAVDEQDECATKGALRRWDFGH
jgi:hypothetical protein